MSPKITIVGSTGKLGSLLLKFLKKNNIQIDTHACYKNKSKLYKQKSVYKIRNSFILSDDKSYAEFKLFLQNKINIIYFLDYGSQSLLLLDIFIKYNSNSIIAIANKEMIIAAGNKLISKIKKSNNKLIPLDSEHYSLYENINNTSKTPYFNPEKPIRAIITYLGYSEIIEGELPIIKNIRANKFIVKVKLSKSKIRGAVMVSFQSCKI